MSFLTRLGKGLFFASVFCGATLFYSGTLQANDTSVGGIGVDLVSLTETSVQMKAEDIVITYEQSRWQVVATYTFQNTTESDVSLQVGFPEVGCPTEEESECHAKAFVGLKTEVDGKPVQHRKGSLKKSERWAAHLGTFWLFDVTFPAKQDVRVVHRYTMDATMSSMMDYSGVYVTRTGATWAGPISNAKFTIRVPVHALHLYANDTLGAPSDPTFVKEGAKAYTQLVFQKKNWIPTGDLHFGFAPASSQFQVPRLDPEELKKRAVKLRLDPATLCAARPPYVSEIKSAAEAQSCKNVLYAGWGFPFKNAKLNELFYAGAQGWRDADLGESWSRTRDPAPFEDFLMSWVDKDQQDYLKAMTFAGEEAIAPAAAAPATTTSATEASVTKTPPAKATPSKSSEEKGAQNSPNGPQTALKTTSATAPPKKSGGCSLDARQEKTTAPWFLLLVLGWSLARRRTYSI